MLGIGNLDVGQVWAITSGAKRVAKVLSLGETEISIPSDKPNRPPTLEMRKTATVQACTPAKPIPGFVTPEEADQGMVHRLRCKDDFGYDMWREVWIVTSRERVVRQDRPRVIEGDWEWILKVHEVIGRHARHEQKAAHGRIAGAVVDGALINPDNVHPQLFDKLGKDEETQAELKQKAHDEAVIAAYEKLKAAKDKEKRQGPANEAKEWGPSSKLKTQLDICGLQRPDKSDGKFNERARALLSPYLNSIGINPWNIMTLNPAKFKEAVEVARQKMPV